MVKKLLFKDVEVDYDYDVEFTSEEIVLIGEWGTFELDVDVLFQAFDEDRGVTIEVFDKWLVEVSTEEVVVMLNQHAEVYRKRMLLKEGK